MSRHPTRLHSFGPAEQADARAAGLLRPMELDGIAWSRMTDDHHGIARGTVMLDQAVLPAYPHIPRIVALRNGVARNLTSRFTAEEKIDGYNVRLVWWRERVAAFTRGGFLCPFTLDRLPDLGDFAPWLRAHPELVLCTEVAGPGNPYIASTPPAARDGLHLFVFDVMRLDGTRLLSVAERNRLLKGSGLPMAPAYGWFEPDALDRLEALVLELDARGVEGLVFKPRAGTGRLKYVTPRVNLEDVLGETDLVPVLDPGFYRNRLVRLAVGMNELGAAAGRMEEVARALGDGMLSGLLEAIRQVGREGTLARDLDVHFRTEAAIDRFLSQVNRVSRTVRVEEVDRRRQGDFVILHMRKHFVAASDRLRTLLAGASVID